MLRFFWGKPYLSAGVFICAFISLIHFSYKRPAQEVAMLARKSAIDFVAATEALHQVAEDFKFDRTDVYALRDEVKAARKAFKKCEFILEYYYPAYVEEHINGAPLFHIEQFDTRPIVLPPEGLQVLDELIFSDEAKEEKAQIAALALQLHNKTKYLVSGFSQRQLTDAEVIEALRGQLVRIFAMGVTGFDTPGSFNALEEAQVSLMALKEASIPFLNSVSKERAMGIQQRFDDGIAYLGGACFDAFDRLAFLKNFVNPLYADLHEVRKDLQLKDDPKLVSARRQQSVHIFSDDFLDPYFYTELTREEDSDELLRLGKKLFYDPLLSSNSQMSCGTCHNPAKAFTDGKKKSESNVVGETVQRNAPTLLNAVYADRYFYDLRAYTLEQQAEHVIFNHQEFNTAYGEIVTKLNNDKNYQKLFRKALGSKRISREGFSKALASYVLSLRSFNSEFDKYVRGEVEHIEPKVKQGFNLFMGKAACATCHFPPTFSGLVPPRYTKNEGEILGVLESPYGYSKQLDPDMGRVANQIYSEEAWIFERSFKTTTVRNVELTAPYFHNGAYRTLEQVVDFYDHGGGLGIGLEVTNQTLPGGSLQLNVDEKEALIAFMKSLTDTAGFAEEDLSASKPLK